MGRKLSSKLRDSLKKKNLKKIQNKAGNKSKAAAAAQEESAEASGHESTGTGLSTDSQRTYGIHCQSGSGHTVADMVRYHDPVTRF